MVAELHVFPHAANGGWTLAADGAAPGRSPRSARDAAPRRWFATLAEAERAARRQADAEGARVYLHDRYHRVRALAGARAVQV